MKASVTVSFTKPTSSRHPEILVVLSDGKVRYPIRAQFRNGLHALDVLCAMLEASIPEWEIRLGPVQQPFIGRPWKIGIGSSSPTPPPQKVPA